MSEQSLPTPYQQTIHMSRYSKFRDDFEVPRRETWPETLDRWAEFWINKHPDHEETILQCRNEIERLGVMPSMRSLMTAGRALDRDNVAGYNCSYLPIEHPRCFDELMYILMCGTGVGFSVERQYINELPEVAEELHPTDTTIVVMDSRIGWSSALREMLSLLYAGKIPKWDLSKIRPAGARLKTFGGRASGPEPLDGLFKFAVNMFRKAAGRKLNSLECHDLVCKIADIVVVGGVRRSALISLSNLSDDRMRNAKSGQWWEYEGQRALSNNSYVADEKPNFKVFFQEWESLYASMSGERGIFSRVACQQKAAQNGRRDPDFDFGTNPCSEIILRPYQFCNLSEIVARPDDTLEILKGKVKLASIIGTFQATLTDFRYLRKKWKNNCEEERLLGVSITGVCDHPVLSRDEDDPELIRWLEELGQVSIDTNKEWAGKLKINQAAAITCVKPSGTVSQLVDSASGIHPRFSHFYIRRIRQDKKDPVSQFLIDRGIPYEEDQTNPSTWVFSFPIKAPDGAIVAKEMTAMRQLRLWDRLAAHWCEHKPSMTAYYTDDDFLEVGNWVWNNFDRISGISFLPYSDHVYPQAPYEEIDRETYDKLAAAMPETLDWDELVKYESEDQTTGMRELACSAAGCEI